MREESRQRLRWTLFCVYHFAWYAAVRLLAKPYPEGAVTILIVCSTFTFLALLLSLAECCCSSNEMKEVTPKVCPILFVSGFTFGITLAIYSLTQDVKHYRAQIETRYQNEWNLNCSTSSICTLNQSYFTPTPFYGSASFGSTDFYLIIPVHVTPPGDPLVLYASRSKHLVSPVDLPTFQNDGNVWLTGVPDEWKSGLFFALQDFQRRFPYPYKNAVFTTSTDIQSEFMDKRKTLQDLDISFWVVQSIFSLVCIWSNCGKVPIKDQQLRC